MRKLLNIHFPFFFCLLFCDLTHAQIIEKSKFINLCKDTNTTIQLWGIAAAGGVVGNNGLIFRVNGDGTDDTVLQSFNYTNGSIPTGGLTIATDGKLYGLTANGGTNNGGVIFNIDPSTGLYTVVFNFDSINGFVPITNLILASDQRLYGITGYGASNGNGGIFSFDIDSNIYTRVFDFSDSTGRLSGNLMQSGNGKLYAMTGQGGLYNGGLLYSLDIFNHQFARLVNFSDTLGISPWGSLIEAKDGKLYGTTSLSPFYGRGTIFSYDPVDSIYKVIHYFANTSQSGWSPMGSLVQANNGKLYGMTELGGSQPNNGTIFSYDLDSNTYTTVFDFSCGGYNEGMNSLILGSDGKLYGMASGCGNFGDGNIFYINTDSNTYTEIHSFNYTNGSTPFGYLLELKCNISTGISSMPNDAISVFPNPSDGNITITGNYNIESISITNLIGQQIIEQKNLNQQVVEMQIKQAGIYFVTIKSGSLVTTKKMIVQ